MLEKPRTLSRLSYLPEAANIAFNISRDSLVCCRGELSPNKVVTCAFISYQSVGEASRSNSWVLKSVNICLAMSKCHSAVFRHQLTRSQTTRSHHLMTNPLLSWDVVVTRNKVQIRSRTWLQKEPMRCQRQKKRRLGPMGARMTGYGVFRYQFHRSTSDART